MTGLPIYTEQTIANHLDQIGRLFKPGARLTLLVRNDIDGKDADLVVTNDTMDEAIAALVRRKEAAATAGSGAAS